MRNKIFKKFGALAILLSLSIIGVNAQQLDDNSAQGITLNDGTKVLLYRALSSELNTLDKDGKTIQAPLTNDYYYLPANLRLALRKDNVPEFLFTKFTTESRTGISGAIMHFLMQIGLSQKQQDELQLKLREVTGNQLALVKGQMQVDPSEDSFQIISATVSDKGMATTIVKGRAPTLEGGKTAIATRLTPEGAQLLASSFEKSKSIADLSISLNFEYTTILPAFKGKFVYDWKRTRNYMDTLLHKYSNTKEMGSWWAGGTDVDKTTDAAFKQLTDSLMEKKCVYMEIRESGVTDERLTKIREAFMQMFLSSFTSASEKPPLPELKGPEERKMDDLTTTSGDKVKAGITGFFGGGASMQTDVKINSKFFAKLSQGTTETISIDYALPIKRSFSLVGNLGEWYNGVRDNKSCVNSVNLNDPFFQYRDIRFIMDLEAKEMFEKEINYVTINARKKRSVGNSFEDRVTMDSKYFAEKGIQATMTYARGEDKDSDAYEYMAQWSLRGGNVYPKEGTWQKGKWEGVTLTPPIKPINIDFEADIEELKEAGYTRVVLQVRYSKFGQEVEENIPISVAKDEANVSKTIFIDRNTKGYAYRLVFNNKVSGKMATEFSSKINDNYVYAVIPKEFKDNASPEYVRAIEAAKSIAQPSADGKVTVGKVLDSFKDVFGTVTVTGGKN